MPIKRQLNARQMKFVENYLISGNATQSAIKAGYSEKNAYNQGSYLLSRPRIQNLLQSRIKEMQDETISSPAEVLKYLTAVLRGNESEEIAMNVGKGKGVTEVEKIRLNVSPKDRLKAAEMLAKINGMFLTRTEVDFAGAVPVVIRDDI